MGSEIFVNIFAILLVVIVVASLGIFSVYNHNNIIAGLFIEPCVPFHFEFDINLSESTGVEHLYETGDKINVWFLINRDINFTDECGKEDNTLERIELDLFLNDELINSFNFTNNTFNEEYHFSLSTNIKQGKEYRNIHFEGTAFYEYTLHGFSYTYPATLEIVSSFNSYTLQLAKRADDKADKLNIRLDNTNKILNQSNNLAKESICKSDKTNVALVLFELFVILVGVIGTHYQKQKRYSNLISFLRKFKGYLLAGGIFLLAIFLISIWSIVGCNI